MSREMILRDGPNGYKSCLKEKKESWVCRFVEQKGSDLLCVVKREFMLNDSNLIGLSPLVCNYGTALRLILDRETDDLRTSAAEKCMMEFDARKLYRMIHARFIRTESGMQMMLQKILNGAFGTCPTLYCPEQNVLPVGMSDNPPFSIMKIFCPRCWDMFKLPEESDIDLLGSWWGTKFHYMLLAKYPSIIPRRYHERNLRRMPQDVCTHSALSNRLIVQHSETGREENIIVREGPGGCDS